MPIAKFNNGKTLQIDTAQKVGSTTIYSYLIEIFKHDDKDAGKQSLLRAGKIIRGAKVCPFNPEHKILIIRDPISRMQSIYSDRVLKKNRNNSRETIKSWDDFITNFEKYRIEFPDIGQHSRQQVIYFGEENIENYERVFLMSDLSNLVPKYISEIAGIKVAPIHKKASGTAKRNLQVTEAHKSLIQQYFKDDYDYFGHLLK